MVRTAILCNAKEQVDFFQDIIDVLDNICLTDWVIASGNDLPEKNHDQQLLHKINYLLKGADALIIHPDFLRFHHYLSYCIKGAKHVYVPYPYQFNLEDAGVFQKLADEANIKLCLSQPRRKNSLISLVKDQIISSRIIELQIHDQPSVKTLTFINQIRDEIDMIGSVIRSKVTKVQATGVPVDYSIPGIINARLEYNNGCVLNITYNSYSNKKIHECTFYSQMNIIKLDFLKHSVEEMVLTSSKIRNNLPKKNFSNQELTSRRSITIEELSHFRDAIIMDKSPDFSLEDYRQALYITNKIFEKISSSQGYAYMP